MLPPLWLTSHLALTPAALLPAKAAMSATAAITVADHAAAVGQYFGSVRVPASFLAGASFGGLFALKKSSNSETKADEIVRSIYHFAIASCFLLAINTIIIATAAATKNLYGGFDTLAESGYMLLKREFHYEFVMTRWSFLVALFSFLVATTNRILYEFKLFSSTELRERKRLLGTAVCLLMSSLLFHLLSFINSTLFCWNSLLDMTMDLFKMILTKGSFRKPLEPLSILFMAAGAGCVIYSNTLKGDD